jgi:hypothetical protein
MSRAAPQGKARQPKKGTHHCRQVRGRNGEPAALSQLTGGQRRSGNFLKTATETPSVPRLPNHESDSDHRMLPIRWILPIVGALFALALAPLGFSPQDSVQNTSVAFVERPEPRQTIVPAGLQRNDRIEDADRTSPDPDAADVTGNIQPATPDRAEQVTTPPSKRIRHVQRRSRKVVHQQAKQPRVANFFGAQQARRTPKPDMKFNAVY